MPQRSHSDSDREISSDYVAKNHSKANRNSSTIQSDTDVQISSDCVAETYNLPGESLNIVLLGKAGNGKSATANSIFGEKIFESRISLSSVTKTCKKETGIIGERNICLVDTPGTMDINHPDEALKEIGTAIALLPDGFDAFVLVLRIDARMTKDEQMTVIMLKRLFGEDILKKYGVLVFTHGDIFTQTMKMNKEKQTFREYMQSQKGEIQTLLDECNYRFFLIDNLEKDPGILREQVIEIIACIDQLVKNNYGKRYTSYMFDMAKTEMKELENESDELMHTSKEEEVGKRIGKEAMNNGGCFPPDALVILHDGRTITIADLRVGHKVLSATAYGKLVFSEVYFFAHLNPNATQDYINLISSKQGLQLTPEHHIYIVRKGQKQTIPAREVKIGDNMLTVTKEMSSLIEEPVTRIFKSTEIGIYAPVTMSGSIIVNKIVASCYVDIVPPTYSHTMLWPLRQLYRISPSLTAGINVVGNEGMPIWIQFIMATIFSRHKIIEHAIEKK